MRTFFVGTLLLPLFLLAGCGNASDQSTYTGYVEVKYRYIAAEQAGRIITEPVTEGDRVEKGDLLFRLEAQAQEAQLARLEAQVAEAAAGVSDISAGARPEEMKALQARLSEARARYTQARSDRDRHMALVEQELEPQAVADKVQADYRAARARLRAAEEAINIARLGGREGQVSAARAALEAARQSADEARYRLAQRSVSAPVNASVEEIYYRPGEVVGAGRPVMALLPENAMVVRFFVSQQALPGFSLGQELQIKADGLDQPIEAKITFISSRAEFTPPVIYSADSREPLVFMVEARPATQQGLHAGLPVDVEL
jgi:HlyD family secretion protein